jgi:hypothetical protein
MIGLVVLTALGLYVYAVYIVVRKYARKARAAGRPGWHYGLPAFLVMYLPIFWDHIPTMVVLQYQCMNNAGLTVHKTPDQWKAENPGVSGNLIPDDTVTTHQANGIKYYILNQRINWEIQGRRLPLGLVYEKTYRIVDSESKEILIEQKDYDIGMNNPYVGHAGFRDYKVWLWLPPCSKRDIKDNWQFNELTFSDYLYEFENLK